jgi:3-isopropylmalate/(R)-2-methylmalate dehydratase large subunit
MTIAEKILAAHAGKDTVQPNDFILANVDLAFANDITAPLAIKKLKEWGVAEVFDKNKIALIPDHFTPNKDIQAAEQCAILRRFVEESGIANYFEVGSCGIEHVFLPEQGFILPGSVVIGADSHTCTHGALGAFASGVGSTDLAAVMATGKIWLKVPASMKFIYRGTPPRWVTGKDLILHTIGDIGVDGATYRVMEFTGETIANLPISGRLTMCNMAVEAGAKSGIIAPDERTSKYLEGRARGTWTPYQSDPDAAYVDTREYDVSTMEPQVACPPLPSNTRPVSKASDIKIDQAVIGSCTNGHLDDLASAAAILKGKRVHPKVRAIVVPATPQVYLEALEQGLIKIFVEAGAVVGPPTCGPCLGGHMGVLASGEKAVATTNRNFVGRMGHPEGEVYLASPVVAAASAITGHISHPADVID